MNFIFPSLGGRASFALFAMMVATSACAREFVRGSDDPSVDRAAMSTGLDKEDIERSLQTLLNQLRGSAIMADWRAQAAQGDRQIIAVTPFINETDEHIDPQLDAMLSDTESWMVGSEIARVVSQERQAEMIRQVEGAQRPVFDPRHIPQYGKQFGVKFFITGKVAGADERTADARRVQYFIFMQVIDAETSEIRWQQKAYVTKAIR
jgi:PBP1b-binding outer membrane lipoprotein LpoB